MKKRFLAPRFSLRTLLVLFTLTGLIIHLVVAKDRATCKQERTIREFGGQTHLDIYCDSMGRQMAPAIRPWWLQGQDWLCYPFRRIVNVDLCGAEISDKELRFLLSLKDLQCLDLSGANITDADIEYLTQLDSLRELDIWDTTISDAGIEVLLEDNPSLEIRDNILFQRQDKERERLLKLIRERPLSCAEELLKLNKPVQIIIQ